MHACDTHCWCPRSQSPYTGVLRAGGGPVGEPLVDDMAGPADGVRAQPQGLGECAVGAPSTQRSSADADAVEHVGHSQHGFGGDPWQHFSFPHSRRRPRRRGRRGGRPGSARLAARRRWRCLSHQRSFAPPSWGPVGVIWWSWAKGYEAARNAQERSGTLANAPVPDGPPDGPTVPITAMVGGTFLAAMGASLSRPWSWSARVRGPAMGRWPVVSAVVRSAIGILGRGFVRERSWGGLAATRLH